MLFCVIVFIVGYRPLMDGQHHVMHDSFNAFLPYRNFFSAALHDGLLPAWNPYINLGYPFPADPQGGAWSPMVWLLSTFRLYDVAALQIEWLAHAALGGVGLGLFLRRGFRVKPEAAATASILYMLSGFFVSSAQLMVFINAGGWIPWVIWRFWTLLREPSPLNALYFALPMSLLLLDGYPSFALSMAYGLACWALVHFLRKPESIRPLMPVLLLAGGATFLLTVGYLFSFVPEIPTLLRTSMKGTFNTWQVENPFGPRAWLTFLSPLVNYMPEIWLRTNPSLAGGFMGWWVFLSVVVLIPRLERRQKWGFAALSAFLLLLSCGVEAPLLPALREVLPGLSGFRHSSQFRVYFLLLWLIVMAVLSSRHQSSIRPRTLHLLVASSIALALASLFWSGLIHDFYGYWKTDGRYKNWWALGRYNLGDARRLISLWAVVQAPLLAITWALYAWKPRQLLTWMAFFSAGQILLATHALTPHTLVKRDPLGPLNRQLAEAAARPPAPPLHGFELADSVRLDGFSDNRAMMAKIPSHQGYNPFQTMAFARLTATEEYKALFHASPVELTTGDGICTLTLTRFDAEGIGGEIDCDRSTSGKVKLWQMAHRDWSVEINEQEQAIDVTPTGQMQVASSLPAGVSTFVWRFTGASYKFALGAQIAGYLIFAVLFVHFRRRERASEVRVSSGA